MIYKNKDQLGFTIVELLIVIVIIGVLAAITIVAYNGIQERARISSVSSALSQASKKLAAYAVDGNGYPADLATIGIVNTDAVSYQYAFNNSVNPITYCITATSGSTSYKTSSASTSPATGGCAGHGQGGVASITNLASNPSIETNSAGYSGNGTSTVALSADRAHSGTSSLKVTTTGTTSVGTFFTIPVIAGKTYTISGYAYFPASFGSGMRACAWGAAMSGLVCGSYGSAIGSWQRISYTFQAVNTASATLYFYNGATQPAIGSVAYLDSIMLTEGSATPNYADGSTTDWTWNGSINNSTSTGPPQ